MILEFFNEATFNGQVIFGVKIGNGGPPASLCKRRCKRFPLIPCARGWPRKQNRWAHLRMKSVGGEGADRGSGGVLHTCASPGRCHKRGLAENSSTPPWKWLLIPHPLFPQPLHTHTHTHTPHTHSPLTFRYTAYTHPTIKRRAEIYIQMTRNSMTVWR